MPTILTLTLTLNHPQPPPPPPNFADPYPIKIRNTIMKYAKYREENYPYIRHIKLNKFAPSLTEWPYDSLFPVFLAKKANESKYVSNKN